ncbi:MAG: hypothetical protein WB762_17005 [Candidatus Sulfotelmatobacter sp.]
MDLLERQIRQNVLLGLIAELYDRKLSDAISVKEWLEAKVREPAVEPEQPRCTNHYLCLRDNVRWDSGWSCMCDHLRPNSAFDNIPTLKTLGIA